MLVDIKSFQTATSIQNCKEVGTEGKTRSMSVSKKIRFEVFKRDGFQCMYCGRTPPDIVLECDHIEPVALGGSDDTDNLVTACFDCNRGKRHVRLNVLPSPLKIDIAGVKEKAQQLAEYRKYKQRVEDLLNQEISTVIEVFQEYYRDHDFTGGRKRSLREFLTIGLELKEIEKSMVIACKKINDDPERAVKYFFGICWMKARAAKLIPQKRGYWQSFQK